MVAQHICIVTGDGEEALRWFDRVVAPMDSYTAISEYVKTEKNQTVCDRMVDLAWFARRWFQSSWSGFLPKDNGDEAYRARCMEQHALGWQKAKEIARQRIIDGIEYGADKDDYGNKLRDFFDKVKAKLRTAIAR